MLPRCRALLPRSIQSDSWLESSQLHFRRFRSGEDWSRRSSLSSKPSVGLKNELGSRHGLFVPREPKIRGQKRPARPHFSPGMDVHSVRDIIQSNAHDWARLPHVLRRLEGFGIPRAHLPDILACFIMDIRQGMLSSQSSTWDLSRFTFSPTDAYAHQRLDQIISQVFFQWAADPQNQRHIRAHVPTPTLDHISRLYKVSDLSFPADLFPKARTMKRTFVMHVGPTNSGKTHMALRALAASTSGLYAGPLRLLAHEIWERLNKGQIVPLGMEPETDCDPDTTINMDVADETGRRPTVRKDGDPTYARPCNLRTGEEFRIVDDNAPLTSCTVEMVNYEVPLDVAVVDEIQMIADPERGSSWTNAVLGIPAREIHLCGEETAVPIIQDILKSTGDELVVNRYERLTPLEIQEESLGDDLSRIQKGDCMVVFSRDRIFAVKAEIEKKTDLRCAVVYGRLPPEIRSEQAALFNDPDSGYDVIVASDAIGMGLNLKIKRVVFRSLDKFDGQQKRPLSISQIKQIAGRAGRYGMHGKPGGFVTTLHKDDIPRLCKALATPADPLSAAILEPPYHWMERISHVLPHATPIQRLLEVSSHVSALRPPFRATSQLLIDQMSKFIDSRSHGLLLADKIIFKNCPVQWQDPIALNTLTQILRLYSTIIRVDLASVLSVAPFMKVLRDVEGMMPDKANPTACRNALPTLESMHKSLVLYLWLSFRNSMAFYDADGAYELKLRLERVLEWCLRQISTKPKDYEQERDMDVSGGDGGRRHVSQTFAHRDRRRAKEGKGWVEGVAAAKAVAKSMRREVVVDQ